MTDSTSHEQILHTVYRTHLWLETMRHKTGYGGPISHWWESTFLFTAPQWDWRYEGIIDGYCELYQRTHEVQFLTKALQAADDICAQLMTDGRFRRSSFQFGPIPGGTPHEAAVDVALLRLVKMLRHERLSQGDQYLSVAKTNLEKYWIGVLWNGQGFQDQPYNATLVANKHGTLLEALLLLNELGDPVWHEYIEACVQVIYQCQVLTGAQAGGTIHRGIGKSRLAIPIYTARAMNGLVSYYEHSGDPEAAQSIIRALPFFRAHMDAGGVLWGTYGSGRVARNPIMVAGSGDILRLFLRVKGLGLATVDGDITRLLSVLTDSQLPTGGIPTACGFAAKGLSRACRRLELRDVLAVVGWTDKAFRGLILALPHNIDWETVATPHLDSFQAEVLWRNRPHTFKESETLMELQDHHGRTRYLWYKGDFSPTVYDL